MSYIILVILWLLFYFTHSYLAGLSIKQKISSLLKSGYRWYRMFYSLLFGFFFFGILVYAATLAKSQILATTELLTYMGYMFATFGTIIIVKAFRNFSGFKFIGIRPHNDLQVTEPLVTSGIHAWMRHPVYTGLVLIFLGYFLFAPFLSSLIHLTCLLVYLPFGIYFEEKKLVSIYGEAYTAYKKSVSALIPFKKIKAT
ncbi:hypothetical protein A33Q_2692 [Indibacter alkaliphilus LW1]|jgi:protein-S-isoprenylcysteine O-methyltransferase Ste14|uniref:Protein-S-isoprenylcysteine O-methyltransferase Ste14 n=1 Tax=Indibacter alkaliphilus (strain CCUG 57479 / KCTC 22604 / LW1) TaxID=1189612 RepID=S2DB28_INDAL|nr:isoprenylcysteine carboxylmethyltransferase family protein [Indibacter alkaliphilus]EOZ96099.1 hypothetical protein A33Q_2692 [Indibacter alkaliphilus LW1]